MENSNEYPENEKDGQLKQNTDLSDDDAEFENPSVDPGFESSGGGLKGREDERDGNIDSNLSISEMQKNQQNKTGNNQQNDAAKEQQNDAAKDQQNVAGKDQQNDALNYNNDRENGAYNPKNI